MSEQKPDKVEEKVATPTLSVGRILMGQLIWWIVFFIALYPIFTVMQGTSTELVYGHQKTVMLVAGGFILQWAYLMGFRERTNRRRMLGEYMITFSITLALGMSTYAYMVEKGRIDEPLYWTLAAIVLSVTLLPVVIYDVLHQRRNKPVAEVAEEG